MSRKVYILSTKNHAAESSPRDKLSEIRSLLFQASQVQGSSRAWLGPVCEAIVILNDELDLNAEMVSE